MEHHLSYSSVFSGTYDHFHLTLVDKVDRKDEGKKTNLEITVERSGWKNNEPHVNNTAHDS